MRMRRLRMLLLLAAVAAGLLSRPEPAAAQTAFVPFTRGIGNPGAVALVGGTLLFFLATWLHPIPAGFWRWLS